MISFQEINELRKAGRLDEAFDIADAELKNKPDDIWLKRAMAWILYDQLKNGEELVEKLAAIVNLDMGFGENMFFDNLAWAVARRINAISKYSGIIDDSFAMLKKLKFGKSDGFSALFRSFHRLRAEWTSYLEFCDWWDFDNFMPKDFEEFKVDKREIMSLAEQAYIAYAKALIVRNNHEKILAFIPKLELLHLNHKKYQYPPYYLAKLYQKVGDNPGATKVLLPFVLSKPNDYWVWQLLGDVSAESEMRFSCYSKALTCKIKAEMSVAIKEAYAVMLAEREMYSEASVEISQAINVRKTNSWKITPTLQMLSSKDWYDESKISGSNRNCYLSHTELADSLAMSGMPKCTLLITGINQQKQIANYITSERKVGMFLYPRGLKTPPKIGDTYDAIFSVMKPDGFGKVIKLGQCENPSVWDEKIVDFCGIIKVADDRTFGLVKDNGKTIFIPKALLGKTQDRSKIEGRAVASWDKTMNRPGWQAYIIKQSN